jgi:thiamine-monophosphate kinase
MSARPRASRRFDETSAVALFARRFSAGAARGVELGIGDDAAVLATPNERLVVTVDASVEGTHFERGWLALEDIGFRAFQAAASDLAAMGARPLAAVSALNLPRGFSERELARLTAGQAEAARACRCPVVGGNVARGVELSITTTVLGTASRPLTRGGAEPNDEVWLVGAVGLAAAGLSLLQAGEKRGRGAAEKTALAAWRRPRALIDRGLALVGCAHAAVDVSDGLAVDAGRVAQMSACRLVLEESALRAALPAELEVVARRRSGEALAWALAGGEDYALVATGPAQRRPRWARRIGRCERGRGAFFERHDGARQPLVGGFDHFTRAP